MDPKELAGLSADEKRALLKRRLSQARGGPDLVVAPRGAARVPSFAQERLWLLWRLEGGKSYNVINWGRLQGSLDEAAFAEALRRLAHRHEILRTRYPEHDGRPRVVVEEVFDVPVAREDWRAVPPSELQRRLAEAYAEEDRHVFDLGAAPPLHVRLIRTGEQEHVLLVVLHHIATDGWSMTQFADELLHTYDQVRRGESSAEAPPSLQYSDYAAWQREWLSGERLGRQLQFWKDQLRGAPAVLELPLDHARPAIWQPEADVVEWRLPEPVAKAFEAFAQAEGVSPFMVAAAAFSALLSRYSGQRDLVLGTVTAGRVRPQFERVMGPFINTLALRAQLPAGTGFRALVRQLRDVALGAFSHQELPFDRVVEELRPPRDLSRSPLFQAAILVDEKKTLRVQSAELGMEIFSPRTELTQFDLGLTLIKGDGAWSGQLEYARALFSRATIEGMAEAFSHLLGAMLTHPERPVDELPLLGGAARDRVLRGWNDTEASFPSTLLHQGFEAQVAAGPERIAVVDPEGETLRYGELNARANQLAHRLAEAGIGPESLVGVCLERGVDMVVALLGVLKAGAAYVPLDPEYPRDRLAMILEDAAPRLVVTHARHRPQLELPTERTVCLDTEAPELRRRPAGNPGVAVDPDGLAYVIFTSGSTGRPKGAMNSHRAIANRLWWGQRTYPMTPDDRLLQKTPFSFDVSVCEFFSTLWVGARLVMARPGGHRDPHYLQTVAASQGVTVLNFVPSMFRAFLAEPGLETLRTLRRVDCAGEALPRDLQDQFFARFDCELLNLYGPTEAAVEVSHWRCDPAADARTVPIGFPISNVQLYILDRHLQPVPVGLPGELFIAGVNLARGYYGRPDLTAERFIPDPFGPPGARMYRTGDSARFLPSGAIDFLGRLDFQVKLRGFRIELGDVESAVLSAPEVMDAAVLLRTDDGEPRLVAYVVGRSDRFDRDTLLSWLRARLPDYMVPTAVVTLPALPLNSNGKLDRKALPSPELAVVASGAGRRPRGPYEEQVAGLFKEVLGLAEVSAEDNFFELGGHSLRATQLASRMRQAFRMDVPLREVFVRSTVETLAAWVEGQRAGPGATPAETGPSQADAEGPPAASFAQARMWLLQQLEPESATYNVPSAWRVEGELDLPALHRAFAALSERHPILRTVYMLGEDREVRPQERDPSHFALTVRELTAQDSGPDAVTRQVAAEASRPFDLAESAARAVLVRITARDHLLLLTLHHIATDGWSMELMLRELRALYGAFVRGQPSPLGPPPLPYRAYAGWQRKQESKGAMRAQLDYWSARLRGAPTALELATDHRRPMFLSSRGDAIRRRLTPKQVAAWRKLGHRLNATPFMVGASAFYALLSRVSRQRDVCVGVLSAGRTRKELESVAGLFVNTQVLRWTEPDTVSFSELVTRTRELLLQAQANQDVPFDRVVQALNPPRDLGRTPLFQVTFDLHDGPPGAPEKLEGPRWTPVESELKTSKFELSVTVSLSGDEGELAFEYSEDLFRPETIEALAAAFETLLDAGCEQPERALRQLPMLAGEEKARVLQVGYGPEARAPQATTLHGLIARQASLTPEAEALRFRGRTLTYAQLDARARALSSRLRARGLRAGELVAVCMAQGMERICGLLAVLQAGGAYLPIEPSLPRERIGYLLTDSGATLALVDGAGAGVLPALLPADRVIELSSEERGASPGTALPEVTATQRAYVIYTSGSTGKPKGVEVEHGSAVNLVTQEAEIYGIRPGERVLQYASVGFDLSVEEIFTTLCAGATLVLAPQDEVLPGESLARFLRDERITVASLTPAVLTTTPARELPALTTVISGGESCSDELVSQWQPGRTFFNTYGPTEATVIATWCRCEPTGAPPPIGRPIPGAQIYLLDAALQPVPLGQKGEIWIAGAGVARGYLRRPELTSERFRPDPFSRDGGRMYGTGDLGRWRGDGALEYLGREDQQVKIRGLRIELGEVEQAVRECPGVSEAAAAVWAGTDGSPRLIAYFTGDASPERVREALRQSLPEFMVPSALMPLPRLPLTANGKLDRAALPAPQVTAAEHVAPRDPLETQLAGIWAEALKVEKVSVAQSFFELGGHSLLAARIVDRVRSELNVELRLAELFQLPTVTQLAERIRALRAGVAVKGGSSPLLPLKPSGKLPPLICVHPGMGDASGYLGLTAQLDPDQPAIGLQAPELWGAERLVRIEDRARHYIRSLRASVPFGPYRLLGYSSGGVLAFEIAQQLREAGEEVDFVGLVDTYTTHCLPPDAAPREPEQRTDLAWFAEDLPPEQRAGFLALDERAREAAAVEDLRQRAVIAGNAGAEEAAGPIRALAAISSGLSAYRLRAYPGPVTVFVAQGSLAFNRPTLGWEVAVPAERLEVQIVPGTHGDMLSPPHLSVLVQALSARLRRLQAPERPSRG